MVQFKYIILQHSIEIYRSSISFLFEEDAFSYGLDQICRLEELYPFLADTLSIEIKTEYSQFNTYKILEEDV